MTAPVTHGYPDWGRYVAQADVILADSSAGPTGVDQQIGPFFVAGNKFIGLNILISGGATLLTIGWSTDSLGLNRMGFQTVPFRSNERLAITVPVQGPYMMILIEPQVGGVSMEWTVWTTAANSPSTDGDMAPKQLIANGSSVAAGATRTDFATRILGGPAFFSADSSLATWVAILESYDETGATQGIARLTNATVPGLNVVLPQRPIQIRSVNTTGGAGSIRAYLSSLGAPFGS